MLLYRVLFFSVAVLKISFFAAFFHAITPFAYSPAHVSSILSSYHKLHSMPAELIPWISTDPVHQHLPTLFFYVHTLSFFGHKKLCIGYFFTHILRQNTKSAHFSLFS